MESTEEARTFVPGRCGVVGLGLIGGSFAKALHEGGREVFAANRTRATLELPSSRPWTAS